MNESPLMEISGLFHYRQGYGGLMVHSDVKTRYPLMLVHGAGFRDLHFPVYWGRIASRLADAGAELFFGGQDGWGTVESNARMLARQITEVLHTGGYDRINLICHSKGGLEARAAAHLPEMAGKIASITTIATPHHGSMTVDRLLCLPRWIFAVAGYAVDHWIRLFGDHTPDFARVCREFSSTHMLQFNACTPDIAGIFYQSYACSMHHASSDWRLWISYLVVRHIEGENDGLVSVQSALWGEHAYCLHSPGKRGLSHFDAIDLSRAPLSDGSGGKFDIVDFYFSLVSGLRERGC